tara:strand:- start:231 stop:425 length:195 start_codon:yes stop_codon:yes gene_type:complete
MKEQYSIEEILNAIDELQELKQIKKIDTQILKKKVPIKKIDIPSNTLKLIEEAEKTIKSNLQSE